MRDEKPRPAKNQVAPLYLKANLKKRLEVKTTFKTVIEMAQNAALTSKIE
ncbi:hypothetical protein N481_23290 [Pseudoalteromonas luteoviolacea S4047-1]|uniref:Uncharacterized protein n=1 Tax=Pseudoalteromonas luteoviolacea S4054 TaxID=1129367 RepID=A0A0F6AIR7_9GAMM|nr:hypothetical protein N479_25480 [Pseudoalteromonas luteoviolacea S4054]KZN68178.1 hypothetical protein N481_23290 [Pseudoalteromonas luteoviolacea S4047-1]